MRSRRVPHARLASAKAAIPSLNNTHIHSLALCLGVCPLSDVQADTNIGVHSRAHGHTCSPSSAVLTKVWKNLSHYTLATLSQPEVFLGQTATAEPFTPARCRALSLQIPLRTAALPGKLGLCRPSMLNGSCTKPLRLEGSQRQYVGVVLVADSIGPDMPVIHRYTQDVAPLPMKCQMGNHFFQNAALRKPRAKFHGPEPLNERAPETFRVQSSELFLRRARSAFPRQFYGCDEPSHDICRTIGQPCQLASSGSSSEIEVILLLGTMAPGSGVSAYLATANSRELEPANKWRFQGV